MLKKLFDSIAKFYSNNPEADILISDNGEILSLLDKIEDLENRVLKLEDENVSLTNELYKLENSLESKFEQIFPTTQELKNLY